MIQPALADDPFLADVASRRGRAGVSVWWLGQSGFLVQAGGRHLLLDPYLSDSLTRKYAATDKPHVRLSGRVVAPERLGFVDVVTSSHNHTDHLDADTIVPLLVANPSLTVVVPEANRAFAASRLGVHTARLVGLDDGLELEAAGFAIHGVPAAHEQVERDLHGRCLHMGYVVRCGGVTLYHAGDCVPWPGQVERLRPLGIDVALLPINGRAPERRVPGNFWGAEAAQLAHAIGARLAIPCHYDMFAFNTATPDAFVAEATRLGLAYRVLRGGEAWSSAVQTSAAKNVTAHTDRISEKMNDTKLSHVDTKTVDASAELAGHTRRVSSVCFNADGTRALSGSLDRTIRLWEVPTGRMLRCLEGHATDVNAVAFSSDGRTVASCSGAVVGGENLLRLWSAETGAVVRDLAGHDAEVSSVSLDSTHARAISCGADATVRLWDTTSGQCLRVLTGHEAWVRSVAYLNGTARAVSGSMDRTVRVWSLDTGTCVSVLDGHTDNVYAVASSPDGQRALSGSRDKTIRLWDVQTGRCIRVLEGHTDVVRAVTFVKGDRWALSGSEDKTLRLWDLRTGQTVWRASTTGLVLSVAASPDGTRALAGTYDRKVLLWELPSA